jgi:hypothetical protein
MDEAGQPNKFHGSLVVRFSAIFVASKYEPVVQDAVDSNDFSSMVCISVPFGSL